MGAIRKHIRMILRQLRPVDQFHPDLNAALADLRKTWASLSPDLELEIANNLTEIDLNGDYVGVLYRIVQESISNAVRHGQAKHIKVLLRMHEGLIRATVLQ